MASMNELIDLIGGENDLQELKECLETTARSCASSTFREEFVACEYDPLKLLNSISFRWKSLQDLANAPMKNTQDGEDDDDDGLSYTFTTTRDKLNEIPQISFRDPDTAASIVEILLSCFRFLRNICVLMPITQSKLHSLLPLAMDIMDGAIVSSSTSEKRLGDSFTLMIQIVLQFLGNMTVNHSENQSIIWPRYHTKLLEKILVECQAQRKVIAYAAAVIINCLHPEDETRTNELVHSRQLIILLLQRCLTQNNDNGEDPALEWITMIFQVMFQRNTTADLYRNLSASLLSSLWSKLTPEQMLLLRMLDMVLTWKGKSDSVSAPSIHDDDTMISFFCDEFRTLHTETPNLDDEMLETPSSDRQAMWKVMEIESSRLMLHIIGTLTSTITTHKIHLHLDSIVQFIPVLVQQLQIHSTTHSRATNAYNNEDVPEDETFGYRSAGIRVLGNFAHQNEHVQDTLRECGGLEVLLNSCNIDPKNPMIREWALVALRHVCEGNEANQAYIRALSPQEVVPRMDLTKMGVEPILEDNKMTLKPL